MTEAPSTVRPSARIGDLVERMRRQNLSGVPSHHFRWPARRAPAARNGRGGAPTPAATAALGVALLGALEHLDCGIAHQTDERHRLRDLERVAHEQRASCGLGGGIESPARIEQVGDLLLNIVDLLTGERSPFESDRAA